MKIVVYKPIVPWPPLQGTRRVTVALLEALAVEHDVTLFAPTLDDPEEEAARELERRTGARVITRRAPNRVSPLHRMYYRAAYELAGRIGAHSPRALYATPPALLVELEAWSIAERPDAAIIEYWYCYRALDRVPGARRILLAHDAEFRVNALAGGARSSWAAIEARREAEACRRVDRVWVLTDEDREALSAHAGISRERFDRLPFGVDVTQLDSPAGAATPTVLFFGAFQADFNRDALRFLLEEIWPRIRRGRPDARLIVAGGGLPAEKAREAKAAGAEVRGLVADVTALYAEAAVVLIPLRFGGGLRIRLLEALAARRAVVATPIGVGGLPGRDGTHWTLGEDAERLAAETLRLLADPGAARALGEAGRDLVVREHSLESARIGIRRLIATV
jgi:glycosyltransferase involved in cell wall biosynthesis